MLSDVSNHASARHYRLINPIPPASSGFRRYQTNDIVQLFRKLTDAEDNRDLALKDSMRCCFALFDSQLVYVCVCGWVCVAVCAYVSMCVCVSDINKLIMCKSMNFSLHPRPYHSYDIFQKALHCIAEFDNVHCLASYAHRLPSDRKCRPEFVCLDEQVNNNLVFKYTHIYIYPL